MRECRESARCVVEHANAYPESRPALREAYASGASPSASALAEASARERGRKRGVERERGRKRERNGLKEELCIVGALAGWRSEERGARCSLVALDGEEVGDGGAAVDGADRPPEQPRARHR
eukprot:3871226-Rhodomonas_salina.2